LIEGLLFDVDGTLVSLKVDVEKLRSTTAAAFVSGGFDISVIDPGKLSTQDMIDVARGQFESGAVVADYASFRRNLFTALDQIEMEWNALAEPIDGTAEVLARLRESGRVKLATLTNSGRAPSEWLLRRYDLLKYFDYTFTRDDVPALKPRPDGVRTALQVIGLPPEKVLFIGDSWIDVRAANTAGVKVASVTTGRYTLERLREEGSDYVLDSLAGIFDILR
jgi:HAD superfamily hydrolase (TIGR01509 family)